MNMDMLRMHRIEFDMENVHICIQFDGGFFNLDKRPSPIHSHNGYELHFCMEGSTCIETETATYSMNQEEGYLVFPDTPHRYVGDEEQMVRSSFRFHFEKNKEDAKQDLFLVFCKAFSGREKIQKISNSEIYIHHLKKMISEIYSGNPLSEIKIRNHFSLFLIQLAEEFLPENAMGQGKFFLNQQSSMDEKNLRRNLIEEYVYNNYDKDISLEKLAKILYLSPKQASRVFENEFSVTFKKYIATYRSSVAMQLLRDTEDDIVSIAFRVGYRSYNGFYTAFLENTGQSPRHYRQMQKKLKNRTQDPE